jgi:carbon-monoxide dehydrogenase large subunit
MDCATPRTDDLPSFDVGFNGTQCTTNPLGVKGCGEAGAIAPFGATDLRGPATPSRIRNAVGFLRVSTNFISLRAEREQSETSYSARLKGQLR